MAGRGRGQGRGAGTRRGVGRPPVQRRNTRSNPEPEVRVEPNVNAPEHHEDDTRTSDMESNFARMLQASIPSLIAEMRRQEREGNGDQSGAGTSNAGATGAAVTAGVVPVIAPVDVGRRKGCDYKTFQSCNPKPFDGKKDTAATHQWLREMEAVIKISECEENQKVKFAAHSLISEALFWWDSMQQALGEAVVDAMTWVEFKKLVLERFCPKFAVNKVEKELMNLEVGTMTHGEYTTRFNEMSRMVPHMVTPEEAKVTRYIQGFPSEIRRLIKGHAPTTYQFAVELTADLFDEVYGLGGRPAGEKRKYEDSTKGSKFNSKKKRKFTGTLPACKTCGRNHTGECRKITCYKCGKEGHIASRCPEMKCFECGEMGHRKFDCPKVKGAPGKKNDTSGKPKVRAFTMTTDAAKETPDVVSGTVTPPPLVT